jgi:PAS domain S-box-containing protein
MYRLPVIRNLPIRYKMLLSYSTVFILSITISSAVIYSIVRDTIKANIESELKNTSAAILNMVQISASVAIKNHLRAVAEKNLEIVKYHYDFYVKGLLSETEAKNRAKGILLAQQIGVTGYIACVDSDGIMKIHPRSELEGVDFSDRAFIQDMIRRKQGYIEYRWMNPGEPSPKPKALFMSYFKPWDWIINVSSYRNEFGKLVDVDDFRESILSLRFGKTGYAFILDVNGNVIVHPVLQGVNVLKEDRLPDQPVKTMLKQKNGQIMYKWRNPGETVPRQKLVHFKYMPDFKWIVATSSYIDEFYAPLQLLKKVILLAMLFSLALVLPITFIISHSITQPMQRLICRLHKGIAELRTETRLPSFGDEMERLTLYFNSFMKRLEAYSQNIHQEIAERKQVEAALRESEEKYRSVMEAVPDPILVHDTNGLVTYLNPAFTKVFGWSEKNCLGHKMVDFVEGENWEKLHQGLWNRPHANDMSSVEARCYREDGGLVHVSIRRATYRDRTGKLSGSVIVYRDVSEMKRLEKEVMDIGDRERQKFGHDLHDDLCPHLIGIVGLGTVLKRKLEARGISEAAQMEKIKELLKIAIVKCRQLARGLCPVNLVEHGLVAALRELAENVQSIFQIPCTFDCEVDVMIRDNTVATHIFRIAQEAVYNAARHATPNEIRIRLTAGAGRLVLTVIDDGIGLPRGGRSEGMGLRIMDFRANMIQAALTIGPHAEGGTEVKLQMQNPVNVGNALPSSSYA